MDRECGKNERVNFLKGDNHQKKSEKLCKRGENMTEKVNSNGVRGKQNKIFISWSGKNSKKIAIELKEILEKKIFASTDLECFVSTVDIASGDDWWNKIKKELKKCKQGILCVTKENIKAPWIFFEAGAMVARDVPTIPLLFNCNINALEGSPIKGKQCIDFYDQSQFLKMIYDINDCMKLLPLEKAQLDSIAKEAYEEIKRVLHPTLKQLKQTRLFNEKYIYPNHVVTVQMNTLYISAPMSSIDDKSYKELRENLLCLKEPLVNIGFLDIHCPLFEKTSSRSFDGKTKAIKENFVKMKQVDCMIIIYPQNVPSSILVEIGYGLSLCKKIVIFYRDKLPYILEEAGETISHIKTYKYDNFNEIEKIVAMNGMDIFDGGNDE